MTYFIYGKDLINYIKFCIEHRRFGYSQFGIVWM